MQHDLSYATFGFPDRDLFAALDAVAATGFEQTEILGQEPHLAPAAGDADLSSLQSRLKDNALRVRTVHAPMKRSVLGAPTVTCCRGKASWTGLPFTVRWRMLSTPAPGPLRCEVPGTTTRPRILAKQQERWRFVGLKRCHEHTTVD